MRFNERREGARLTACAPFLRSSSFKHPLKPGLESDHELHRTLKYSLIIYRTQSIFPPAGLWMLSLTAAVPVCVSAISVVLGWFNVEALNENAAFYSQTDML